jgi:hypothetical protein
LSIGEILLILAKFGDKATKSNGALAIRRANTLVDCLEWFTVNKMTMVSRRYYTFCSKGGYTS